MNDPYGNEADRPGGDWGPDPRWPPPRPPYPPSSGGGADAGDTDDTAVQPAGWWSAEPGGPGGPDERYGAGHQGGWGGQGQGGWGQGLGGPEGPGWPHGSWPPPPQPPRRRTGRVVLGTLLALAVAVAAGVGIDRALLDGSHAPANASGRPGQGAAGGRSTTGAVPSPSGPTPTGSGPTSIVPALVDISTTLGYQGMQAEGTGIVLTSDGEILTNNHVINGATRISATDLGNHRTYQADVVGYDRAGDLAILRLRKASGLTVAPLADSSRVKVGDAVTAVGNAGGTGSATPASGSVVALDQSITAQDDATGTSERLTGLIESDADVQPGDSGGPLVDSAGQVIGVDTAASAGFSFNSGQGRSAHQGFAIPLASALQVRQLIDSGRGGSDVHIGATAMLGVTVSAASADGQGAGGQGGPGQGGGAGGGVGGAAAGALVQGVVEAGPAAKAGLAAGDVITSFGGHAVADPNGLTDLVAQHKPGDKVAVSWTDDAGGAHTATATLAQGPPD